MIKFLCLLMLWVAANTAFAQATYRYKDPETGKTIISDQPPPTVVQDVEKTVSGPTGAEIEHSYALKQAIEKYPVVVYTSFDCGAPCEQALALLNGRGVPFSEKLVATQAQMDDLKKLVGSHNVPSVTVGTQVLEGFAAESWNKLLDMAGYPQSAVYGAKPSSSGAFSQ